MNGSSQPWQYEWKRPQWQNLYNHDKKFINKRTIIIDSTQVSPEELLEQYSFGGSEKGTFILALTIFSTRGDEVGDFIQLELLCHNNKKGAKEPKNEESNPQVERIASQTLQWPDSARMEGGVKGKNNYVPYHEGVFDLWIKPKAKKNEVQVTGIVSACFCRKPPEDENATALNALDTVKFLSLGLDPEQIPLQSLKNKMEYTKEDQSSATAELLLACLCTDGNVFFYSPWALLQKAENEIEDELTETLATFFMGEILHDQVKQTILPLSSPKACVALSIPLGQNNKRTNEKHPSEEKTLSSDSNAKATKSDQDIPFWDPLVWDSTVEPSSQIYRTYENVLSLCVPAFEYVAVAGKGLRVSRGIKLRSSESGDKLSDMSTTGSVAKEIQNSNEESQIPEDASEYVTNDSKYGGFVTFLSLRNFSETRTVFIPFVPEKLSPIFWAGMYFVLVLGGGIAVAIRVDASNSSCVIGGEDPRKAQVVLDSDFAARQLEKGFGLKEQASINEDGTKCYYNVQRFQILPVRLAGMDQSSYPTILTGSMTFSSPSSVAQLYHDKINNQVLVFERSFQCFDSILTDNVCHLFKNYRQNHEGHTLAIETKHIVGHEARIPLPENIISDHDFFKYSWCHLGQGWCLVGLPGQVYFISFEGATALRGAFVSALGDIHLNDAKNVGALFCDIQPTNPFLIAKKNYEFPDGRYSSKELLRLPFTGENEAPLELVRTSEKMHYGDGDSIGHLEEIVVDALESISNLNYRDSDTFQHAISVPTISPKVRFSNLEKSELLLRNCSSWKELERRAWIDGQVPAVVVCIGPKHFVLTLRRIVVENGIATPFHEVLSWLASRKDYFTAASLALDLLRDVKSLRRLWKVFEKIDDEDERTKLEGLLDGIIPIWEGIEPPKKSTLIKLSDMTVGCLTKGGFRMSSTLEIFLQKNWHYDAARTSLMLVAATACCVGQDEVAFTNAMGPNYSFNKTGDDSTERLWPVRCLLQIGIARNYLSTVLLLLNAAIPNELRCRQSSGSPSTYTPSMDLSKSLVKLIISSSPVGADYLLGLVDDQARMRYWPSLEQGTQLELSCIKTDGKCRMFRQVEVRLWIKQNLNRCLLEYAAPSGMNMLELTPSSWLKQVCEACLLNAECNIDMIVGSRMPKNDDSADVLSELFDELKITRKALCAASRSGGLDFDVLIPALLILERRSVSLGDATGYSTQSILNAACYLAGRVTIEEPLFAVDCATIMKQCFLAGNICAGANLVGGKNGLILECCSILIDEIGVTMDEAEEYLCRDTIGMLPVMDKQGVERTTFVPSKSQLRLLYVLSEFVLSIRKYGEFETTPMRGRVNPVFAAQICLRSWLGVTKSNIPESSKWLVSFLRDALGIKGDGISGKRLACAALVRALLWNSENVEERVLAQHLQIEKQFLVQISQLCLNLMESIPPWIANELFDKQAKELEDDSNNHDTPPDDDVYLLGW